VEVTAGILAFVIALALSEAQHRNARRWRQRPIELNGLPPESIGLHTGQRPLTRPSGRRSSESPRGCSG
jgi:hypothetical protein